jgi:signal transduction histidine kinase
MTPSGANPERLLVLAPVGRDATLIGGVLAAAGLECEIAADMRGVCAGIAAGAGAVLVAEEALAGDAWRLLAAAVAGQEPWSDLPVVVLGTRDRGDGVPLPRHLDALGNVTVFDRPLRRPTLVSLARAALRARRRQYAARDVLGQLREAVQQRDHFLAVLGHELRNPLAAISTSGHLLERGGNLARQLPVIRRQTRQLVRLVDDLLDVSRVTAGKITLRLAPVEIASLVDRSVETHAALAAANGVELSRVGDARDVFTRGDEARLEQVLSNLLSNAIKYTPRGGHVRVEVVGVDSAVHLRVADDGIGLAPEDQARVFEPFVQVASALDRARGGMGLGLTLVRTLVERHGGSVSVRSDGVGRGTTFEVRLPREEPPTPSGTVRPLARSGPVRDVLVVEDNDDLRAAFAEVLSTAGHRVRLASDGAGALAHARVRAPEIAFIDVGLPDVDGYELARRLRAEIGPGTFIAALTGYGGADARERAREAGFDVHLTKPLAPDCLERILRGDELEP